MHGSDNKSLSERQVLDEGAKHLTSVDGRLARVINQVGTLELSLNRDIFFSLSESIISQQLTPRAADSIIRKFVALFPEGVIDPARLLQVDEDSLRACGISRQKSSYLKNLAENVLDGSVSLANLEALPDDEAINSLVRIKGVGVWTAKMAMIFSLGRPDILPHEDVGILNAMQRVYLLDEKPNKETAERIAGKWHPYCSIASLYLWKLKDELPWEKEY